MYEERWHLGLICEFVVCRQDGESVHWPARLSLAGQRVFSFGMCDLTPFSWAVADAMATAMAKFGQ